MNHVLRILVVEDEVLISDYITDILEDAGHEVVGSVGSADGAMRLLREQRPDVAILDIKLVGGRDGVDLALDMRNAAMGVPHIFITGSGDPETRKRADATNPLAFLQKPFDGARLLATLATVSAGQ